MRDKKLEEALETNELCVAGVVEPGHNRDGVGGVVRERVRGVIYDDGG